MYNRYIRTDSGTYARIPQEEEKSSSSPLPTKPPPCKDPPPHMNVTQNSTERSTDGITGFLRKILDQFHLEHVDTGDLLLLILLFLLFREDADEELLVALGLLLIL